MVSFTTSVVGAYGFRLTVTDGQLSAADEMLVVVAEVQADNDSTLIAYWKVDESNGIIAQDFAGSHNGTLVNGPVWRPNGGKIGGGLEFDGVDDYVDIGAIDIVGGTGLTIALWFKADDFGASYARFIAKVSENQEHYWVLSTGDIDGTALRFNLMAGGSPTSLMTSTGQIQAGQWYHLAAAYDGNRMRIYKNGVEVANANKSGAVDSNPNVSVAIGNQPPAAGGGWPFDGMIDDGRIYNRAVSATEIVVIANLFTTGQPEYPAQELPTTYELNQNYPNPLRASAFNPSTTISFSLPRSGLVVLSIYTLLGHRVADLVDTALLAGKHSVQWFPKGLSSGVYYYRLESGNFVQTKKMLLVK
jgi:hypothetical protein